MLHGEFGTILEWLERRNCANAGRVPARGVGFEGSEADRTRAHR